MKNIKEMTLKEKLGQLIVAGFSGYEYNEHLKCLIEEYKVSNIILFVRNIKDGKQLFSLNQKLHQEIIKHTSTIPLITIDQEGGMVTRIMSSATFAPGAMTICATNNQSNAYDIGRLMAKEMISYGINMNLAPSLDVNNNPNNSVIGVRSYSSDPLKVAKYGTEYIKGLEEEGLIATAKHFPGHGDTSVDSHLSMPTIKHSKERLNKIELYPFKEAIKNGISAIMSAHVFFPAYENENKPGTLSKNVLTHLLREELGFKGLIISDCMEMKAIVDGYTTEKGAMMGLKAGLDLLCISHTLEKQIGALKEIEEAVNRNEITIEEIDEKVQRVLYYKEKTMASLNKNFYGKEYLDIEGIVENKESKEKAYEICLKSLTLYKGTLISPSKKILVIAPLPFASTIAEDKLSSRNLLLEIKKELPTIDTLEIAINPSDEEAKSVLEKAKEYEEVLVCTYNALLYHNQAKLVNLLNRNVAKLYVVSMRLPYDILAFDDIENYALLYEYTPNSIKVICQMLKGKVKAEGVLPIDLSVKPKIGASLYVGLDQYKIDDNLKYLDSLKEASIDRCFISCHMPEAKETFYEELRLVLEKARSLDIKIVLDVSRKVMDKLDIPDDIYSLRLDYGFTDQEIVDYSNTKPYYIELNASTISKERLEKIISMGLNKKNTRISHNFYPKVYTGLSLEAVKEKNEYIKKHGFKIMAYIPSKNGKRMPLYEGLPTVEEHRWANLCEVLQELKAVDCDEIFFGDSFASSDELKEAVNFDYSRVIIPLMIRKDISSEERNQLLKVHYNRLDESEYFKRSSVRASIAPSFTVNRKKNDVTIDNDLFLRYSGEVCIMKKALEKDERVNVVGRVVCSDFLLSLIKPGDRFEFKIVGEY